MQPIILHPDPASEFFIQEGCFILENSNSGADPHLSIARARVRPGTATKRHFLRGVTERYLIISGKGRVHVGDLPPTEVRPGDVVIIPPDVHQHIENHGKMDLVFYTVCTPRYRPEIYGEP
jgi:mannose-6-phosphate isomerase-like protein (cupin superfamily)